MKGAAVDALHLCTLDEILYQLSAQFPPHRLAARVALRLNTFRNFVQLYQNVKEGVCVLLTVTLW